VKAKSPKQSLFLQKRFKCVPAQAIQLLISLYLKNLFAMKVKYLLLVGIIILNVKSGISQTDSVFQRMVDSAKIYLMEDVEVMKTYIDSANIDAKESPDSIFRQAQVNLLYSKYEMEKVNYNKAKEYLFKAKKYSQAFNDSSMLYDVWMGLGSLELRKGNNAGALKYYLDGLYYITYIQKPQSKKLLAKTKYNIGMTYHVLKSYKKSIEYYRDALQDAEEAEDDYLISHITDGLSGVLIVTGAYEEALQLIRKNLILSKELKLSPYRMGLLYANLGEVFYSDKKNGSNDSARYYLNISSKTFEAQRKTFFVVQVQTSIAKTYYDHGDFVKAKKILKNIEKETVRMNHPTIMQDFYFLLAKINMRLGNSQKAFNDLMIAYENQALGYKESENADLYDIMENYVETENLLIQENLKQKIEYQAVTLENEKKRKRIILYIAGLASLLALSLVWALVMVYNRYMMKQTFNSQQLLHLETSHRLLELEKMEADHTIAENKRIVEISNKNIMHNAMLVEKLISSIKALKPYANKEGLRLINTQLIEVSSFSVEENWSVFEENFAVQYPFFRTNFFNELEGVTFSEFRLSCYILMKLTNAEIAAATLQSPNSLRSAKFRLRQRLNVNDNQELYDKLISFTHQQT